MTDIEGTAVAVQDAQAPEPRNTAVEIRSAFDIKPSLFKAGLKRRGQNRDALMTWIRDALVEGTDWGRIHVIKKDQCDAGKYCSNPYHFSKPSLWKAGAEKIVGMMGLRATWPNLDAELESVRGGGSTIFLKCQLLDMAGNPISEGIGARALDQDYNDANKAFKMAKKSSLIDAVLNAGGLSEVFTQDVEDMDPEKMGEGSDPFQPGEDRIQSALPQANAKPLSTHCPIGKEWKGIPWEEVDAGFLSWILERIDDKPDLTARVRKELESRSVESDESKIRRSDDRIENAKKKVGDYARELTQATNIDQIQVIKDELPQEFEPSLRTFIATREAELGPQ